MQALIDPTRPLREIPKRQCRALARPLDDGVSRFPDRDSAMVEAFRSGAYSMQAMALIIARSNWLPSLRRQGFQS